MSRGIHRLALYGVGSLTCFALALATERAAAAAPLVSRIHAMPYPPRTTVFDQRTQGGEDLGGGRRCGSLTRLLLRSELSLSSLKVHFSEHKVRAGYGDGEVAGRVMRAFESRDLVPEWDRHRSDPKVFVVEFRSPGSPGSSPECRF